MDCLSDGLVYIVHPDFEASGGRRLIIQTAIGQLFDQDIICGAVAHIHGQAAPGLKIGCGQHRIRHGDTIRNSNHQLARPLHHSTTSCERFAKGFPLRAEPPQREAHSQLNGLRLQVARRQSESSAGYLSQRFRHDSKVA